MTAPNLTVVLVSGEELGRYCCTTIADLKRQVFALPRRCGALRHADPRSAKFIGKDGLLPDDQNFTEDEDLQLLLGPRTFAVSALRSRPQERNPPVQMDVSQGLVRDHRGQIVELDYAFDETATGGLIFETVWEDAVQKSLTGGSALLIAYGPAGSGKGHSLFGKDGLIVKTHEYLEAELAKISATLCVEFFEIEQELAYDLLAEDTTQRHRVRWGKDMTKVEGVESYIMDVNTALLKGLEGRNKRREVGSGPPSIRTSQVFNIHIFLEHCEVPSLLQFLRLPASDPLWKFHQQTLREVRQDHFSAMSKSLASVSSVLERLQPREKPSLVPWRESSVTMLMANVLRRELPQLVCLGTCSGADEETWSTLRFLRRARCASLEASKRRPP